MSASANGASSQRTLLPQAGLTPESALIFWQECIELYDTASAALIAAGDPTPTDAEILAEMLDDDSNSGETRRGYHDYTFVCP